MRVERTKYAIITADRPSKFLTSTAELAEDFDDNVLIVDQDFLTRVFETLDEPEKFTYAKVTISVEM